MMTIRWVRAGGDPKKGVGLKDVEYATKAEAWQAIRPGMRKGSRYQWIVENGKRLFVVQP